MTKKRDAGRAAIMNAPAAEAAQSAGDTASESWFVMRENGLHWRTDGGLVRISGYFEILSETRDDDAQAWGLLLRFSDRDKIVQQLVVTRDMFAGEGVELRSLLARRGLYISPARRHGAALCYYLSGVASPKRARVVPRTGWHRIDGVRVFLLPDETFGKPPVEVVYQPPLRESSLFNAAGTLAEWQQHVAARCVGNSRLVLAVSAAFAAPLLELVSDEGGGLHFRGPSRVGKTTALLAAASVWGGEGGAGAGAYVRQWRATSNAVEGVAAAHSDTLLPLDELGQADAREIGAVCYMLSSGQGKARMDRAASLRAPLRFRTLFLSTGEIGLADKIAESGGSVKAGMEMRFLDLPADAGAGLGLFEQLHDAPSAAEFTHALRDATARFYGTAAVAFLRYLVGRLAADATLPVKLRQEQDDLARDWLAEQADAGGQVRSVARRFALVAIAGELASWAEVTSWEKGEAGEAAERCFRAWLAERGTTGAREDMQAVVQLRAFIVAHGEARFARWGEPSIEDQARQGDVEAPPERFKTLNRVGWRRWMRDGEGGPMVWVYYLTPDGMREALKGIDYKAALRTLAERGFLIPGAGGKSAQSVSPPGFDKARAYVVRPSIVGAEEAGD